MRRMNVIVVLIFLMAGFALTLMGCAKDENGEEFHKAAEEHSIDMDTLKNRPITGAAQVLIEDLLRLANANNTCGYPLDESFYLWLYKLHYL